MMDVKQIQELVTRRKQKLSLLQEQLSEKQKLIFIEEKECQELIEARMMISEAARATQLQFKSHVESLVTMAIQTVFPEDRYKFVMRFGLEANRSIIYLLVQQDDKEPYNPEDEQGGGLLDIISFALRVVMWSLERPRSRAIFIMDEPFRFCGKLTALAGNMAKEISQKLGLQILMVTHEQELREIADKLWTVKREKGGWSEITTEDRTRDIIVEKKTKPILLKRRK